jgi:hypothetical protein
MSTPRQRILRALDQLSDERLERLARAAEQLAVSAGKQPGAVRPLPTLTPSERLNEALRRLKKI